MKLVCLTTTLTALTSVNGFITFPRAIVRGHHTTRVTSSVSPVPTTSSTHLHLFDGRFDFGDFVGNFFDLDVECVEECAVNDATHGLLDFSDDLQVDQMFIRGMKVVGQVVVLQQSLKHIQDVMPDELVFQVGFLGVACLSFGGYVAPKIRTACNQECSLMMTSKDRLAFRKLFKPAGFSWKQFRELQIGANAMEWISVTPGEVIDEAAAFFLYQGQVNIVMEESQTEDNDMQEDVSLLLCTNTQEIKDQGLLGEEFLIALLDGTATAQSQLDSQSEKKIYVAGMEGATFLRIDTSKLESLLKNDESMLTSIGSLTYTAMQNRLQNLKTYGTEHTCQIV